MLALALQGVWRLPDRDVEVVTQCKNERTAVGVQALREFHGVLSFLSPGALGVFASASGYSVFAQRSRLDALVIWWGLWREGPPLTHTHDGYTWGTLA